MGNLTAEKHAVTRFQGHLGYRVVVTSLYAGFPQMLNVIHGVLSINGFP